MDGELSSSFLEDFLTGSASVFVSLLELEELEDLETEAFEEVVEDGFFSVFFKDINEEEVFVSTSISLLLLSESLLGVLALDGFSINSLFFMGWIGFSSVSTDFDDDMIL